MSSLIRRLAIRMMKRAGYTREHWFVKRDPVTGQPRLVETKRNGEITDPDDNPIGRDWPARIPARAKMQSKPAKKRQGQPRGRRRGKPNKRFIEKSKARKAQGQ